MATKRVQFTDWLPDQPDNSGALNEAKNVTPVSIGYQPFPNAEDFSGAASENLNSVYVAKYDTEVVLFAGGATKLFKFNSSTEALDLNQVDIQVHLLGNLLNLVKQFLL